MASIKLSEPVVPWTYLSVLVVFLSGCSLLSDKLDLTDPDGDGSPYGEDCDDTRDDVYPGAAEIWYDGVDNDCDPGTADDDADGDGHAAEAAGGDDCDDSNSAVNPDSSDTVEGTGTDQDCDGVDGSDSDGDGYASEESGGDDCNDDDAGVYLDATEVCDGVDNNCNGEKDEDEAEDASTWYRDRDNDGYGDPETATTACEPPESYVEASGDCDDRDETTYPEANEVCEDGVVNDCDSDEEDALAECGLSGTMSLSDADLKLTGAAAGDQAGYSVSGAGDVDGDGLDDLIIGAIAEGTGGSAAGAVYLLLGGGALDVASGTLSLSGADLQLTGESTGDSAGGSVSWAGDVDGDGLDDLIIGAIGEDSGGTSAGTAYLLLGGGALDTTSSTRSLSHADLKLIGEEPGDYAGVSVAGAGDVDGDGLDDLIIGATGDDSYGEYAGAVYLLLTEGALRTTSSTLSLSDADLKLAGGVTRDYAGSSVSSAGDVDGDGLGDVVGGAPGWFGSACLLLGGSALAGASDTDSGYGADLCFTVDDFDEGVGSSVAGAGDVDGDGLDDVLVGAPRSDAAGTDGGAAYLLCGGGALDAESGTLISSSADVMLTGAAAYDEAGWAVSAAGDLDGGGLADLLVGTYAYLSDESDSGMAYLLLGGEALCSTGTLSLSEADFELAGEEAGDQAGRSVTSAGDVDGDGLDELVIGARGEDAGGTGAGAAYLLFGRGGF